MMNDPLKRFRLDAKVALLTGAARGIGLVMARTLAAVGAAVVIQDIAVDIARAEAEQINREGGRAVALGGDAEDPAFAERVVAETIDRLGGLHILVNNASIQYPQSWVAESREQMEQQVSADLFTPLLLCRAVTPIFKAQQFGRIINIGSVQQKRANPDMMTYSLCKGALEKLTIGLSRTLAKDNITVNCIAPGWVMDTVRNQNAVPDEEEAKKAAASIPAGRFGYPTDFDGVILLFCGQAGDYITGQTLFVDGGMHW